MVKKLTNEKTKIKENKIHLQTSHEIWVNCQIKDDVKWPKEA